MSSDVDMPAEPPEPGAGSNDALGGRFSRRTLLQSAAAAGLAPALLHTPVRTVPGGAGRTAVPATGSGSGSGSGSGAASATSPALAVDRPPPQQLTAVSVAPPGQSGFFSLAGQVSGELAKGNPAAYGPHVDDQRSLYWTFGYKPASFADPAGTPEQPTPGSRLYRDAYGVPVVYGDTAADVWFATGWAFAQDRLFEMDAIRRTALGTLAELAGPSSVPGDVQARVLGYTDAEYEAMFSDVLAAEDRVAVDACVAGINAWIEQVLVDPVQRLPAEYVLLQALPELWQRRDVLASGVLIVRSVASAGGNEMANVANLVALQRAMPVPEARGVFNDLFWLEDAKAVTSVPAASGAFPNTMATPAEAAAAFQAMADWATTLPAGLAQGPGTGAYPAPSSLGLPASGLPGVDVPGIGPLGGGASPTAGPPGAGGLPGVPGGLAALGAQLPAEVRAGLGRAVAAVTAWSRSLHGGSYQLAIGPSRTATGTAMLISGPQLGYSYPSELYELEVHGGGYDARGVTVPGLPVVGIGFGTKVAWALTTGESKTIDSFVETVRPNPTGGPPQYRFEGRWVDQQVRSETVRYRPAPDGVPVGPPVESVTVEVARTHHGPIVATAASGPAVAGAPGAGPTSGASLAMSQAYAMWGREVQTLSGILRWNRATTLDEFAAGVAMVTWNENALAADADGNIGYWHPGLYPVRSPGVDLRLPTPGTGGYEWQGFLPFDRMPHAVNPAQGYLANWNTKPAVGWLEDAGVAPGQPAGAYQRVQDVTAMVEGRRGLGAQVLADIDRFIGTVDHRARAYLPLVTALGRLTDLTAAEAEAVGLLASWDHAAYDPPAGTPLGVTTATTDSPAATIFAAVVAAIRQQLFGALPAAVTASDEQPSLHLFDMEPLDNLAMRVLDPSSSALTPSRDYLAGRTVDEVVRAALDAALVELSKTYGTTSMAAWRRPHPTSSVCSLTGGVIGPCLTMPYEDRGTYIHHVVFT